MYAVGLIGLWRLVRTRRALSEPAAGRELAAHALIGFGAWHVVDAILSHWLLGIHRIRMDVPNPLFWDLLWFALFGVLFIAAGVALRRRDLVQSRAYAWAAPWLAAVAVLGGALAARTPDDASVLVVLRPGVAPATLLNQLGDGERVLWNSGGGDVWVLAGVPPAQSWRLYAHGAMLVSGTLLPAGCSAWTRS
jgi:Predicted membrane protein (DUF2243)